MGDSITTYPFIAPGKYFTHSKTKFPSLCGVAWEKISIIELVVYLKAERYILNRGIFAKHCLYGTFGACSR